MSKTSESKLLDCDEIELLNEIFSSFCDDQYGYIIDNELGDLINELHEKIIKANRTTSYIWTARMRQDT